MGFFARGRVCHSLGSEQEFALDKIGLALVKWRRQVQNFDCGRFTGKTKPLGMPTAGALNGLYFVGIPSVFSVLKP